MPYFPLKQTEQSYWNSYLNTLSESERPKIPFVYASFAGTAQITDSLLELYLNGKKTAGSGLLEDYLSVCDPLPKVGNYWIILNSQSEPKCIVRTEKVVTHKFRDVPVEIAIAEGEGDLSLEFWRRVHVEFFTPFLPKWGVKDIWEATVVTEFFSVVYS